MHALGTLLGTPNQLVVNTNIYSTNRVAVFEKALIYWDFLT